MNYLLSLFMLTIFIRSEEMSPMEHQSLHTYNNRSIVKKSSEKRAHRLHKIDEEKAREIAEKNCGEKVRSLRLDHNRLTLYYRAETANCTLYIDALDGRVIDPELIRKGEK